MLFRTKAPVLPNVQGTKFNDLNEDGIHDADEPGLPGWVIFADANSNGDLDTGEEFAITDANGNYELRLQPGTYDIREVAQTGWQQTTSDPASIVIASGAFFGDMDFGNVVDLCGDAVGASTVVLYEFENNGNDSSPNGLNLTPVNNPTFDAGQVGSSAGKSIIDTSPAPDQHWAIPTSSEWSTSNANDAFSISAWIKLDGNFGFNDTARIWSQPFSPLAGGSGFGLRITSVGFVGGTDFGLVFDYGQQLAAATPSINDNVWHHVAGTFDPTDNMMRVYLDGVEIGSIFKLNGSDDDSGTVMIGGGVRPTTAVDDATYLYDQIHILKETLSAQQIADIHSGALSGLTLVANDQASEAGQDPGQFTITRTGDTTDPLTVQFKVEGTANYNADFKVTDGSGTEITLTPFGGYYVGVVTIAAGQSSAVLNIVPESDAYVEATESVMVTVLACQGASPITDTVTIADDDGIQSTAIVAKPDGDQLAYQGSARTEAALALDDNECDCGCTGPQVIANETRSSAARPTFQVTLRTDPHSPLPSNIDVQLVWNGQNQTLQSIPTAGHSAGDLFNISVMTDDTVAETGRYAWEVHVSFTVNGELVTRSFSGSTFVVSHEDSSAGAGWFFGMLDRLYEIAASPDGPAGLLMSLGTGGWLFFEDQGDGTYAPEAGSGRPGHIIAETNSFEYVTPEGEVTHFNDDGMATHRDSADGHDCTQFTYIDADNDGEVDDLATMTTPDGAVSAFSYQNDRLDTITTSGRQYSFEYDINGDLIRITEPDGRQREFTYDSEHRITGQTYGDLESSFTYQDGMVATMALGSAAPALVDPVARRGLNDLYVGDVRAKLTDSNGNETELALDEHGRETAIHAADGGVWNLERDSEGFVTATTDALGRVTQVTRDAVGYVTSEILPDGSTRSYEYNHPLHRLTKITDELGNETLMTYDVEGHLVSQTDAVGNTSTFTYIDGLLATATDALGRTTQYFYDAAERLIREVNPLGDERLYTYDANGFLATMTDELGRVTSYVNDALGRVLSMTDAIGNTWTHSYDSSGLLDSMTDPLGQITHYSYDNRGLMLTMTEAVGTTEERTTIYEYDEVGNLAAIVDALGQRIEWTYDEMLRAIQVTEAVGTTEERSTFTAYNLVSNVVSTTDALGRITAFLYDNRDRLTETVEAVETTEERSMQYEYDAASNMTRMIDPLGRITVYGYDAIYRQTSMTEAFGTTEQRTWSTEYDAVSNVIATVDPLGRRDESVYDGLDRLTLMTEAVGTTEQRSMSYEYDAVGNMTAYVDALGRRDESVFDGIDRETSMTEAVGTTEERTMLYEYDAVSNLTAYVDALGRRDEYFYDGLYRQTSMTEAVGTAEERSMQYEYDLVGNMTAYVDALGRRDEYDFDALYRTTSMTEAVGTAEERSMQYEYDLVGNMTAYVDALGRRSESLFDNLDREVLMTEAVGTSEQRSMLYEYDAANNLTAYVDALGRRAEYDYDALYRQTLTTQAVGTTEERAFATEYDLVGNVTASIDPLGRRDEYLYDAIYRQTSMTEAVGSADERSMQYEYDDADNLTAYVDALGRRAEYGYDALYRQTSLTEAVGTAVERGFGFEFDLMSNQTAYIDALGRRAEYDFDALYRQTSVTEAVGTTEERTFSTEYDLVGNMTASIDALDRRDEYDFDALYRTTSMTEAVGTTEERSMQYEYDLVGNLTAYIDALGRRDEYGFDAHYRQTSMTESVGTSEQRSMLYEYDLADNMTAYVDALGRRRESIFDNLDREISMTEAVGTSDERSMQYEYDAVNNLAAYVDPLGRRAEYDYDFLYRQTSVTEAVGSAVERTFSTTYDLQDNVLTSTDARGNQALYFYDDLDRLTSTTDALGNTSSSEYDAADNLIASIDELGLQSDYEFDALDRLFRATDPLGRQYLTAYDAMDNVLSSTDAKGNETEYEYDALYRRTGLTDALDNFFATAYDANDNVVSTTDARGFTTVNSFDALERMVLSTDPIGNTMGYVFDAADNLLQSIDELGFITQHTYDALDRRISSTTPVGGVWQTAYDAAGNVVLETDAVGNQTAYTLDALDRVTAVTDARGGVTLMLHDADSNLVATTDSVGNVTGFTYDAISRKTSETDPLGETMTYEYDAASRMTAQVDRLGRRREFVFDDGYRIVQEAWKDDLGVVVETFDFTFDDNDNLLTATDSDGTITSTYDALDRLVTRTDVWSKTLTYAYDEVGNVVSVTDSEGGVETSAHDGLNRLTRRDFTDGVAELRLDITYTPRSEIATQTRYADLAGTTQIGSTQFAYDGNGRTTSIDHLDGLGASLESLAYTHDVADRLTSEDRNGNVRAYDYDATNQLIDDSDNQYQYDLNGNRAPMPGHVVGAGNRLLSDGVWTYTYNAEGNRVTKTHIVDDEEWTYEYDHNNHLVAVEHRDVLGVLLARVDIAYDALGRRIEVVTDELGLGVTVERYAYASDDVWADLDAASSLTTRYIHGNRVDEHIAHIDQLGVVNWYLTDRLGSTIAVANNIGAVATQITYDGFGNVLTNTVSIVSDRYLYTGREFFFQISLQHNRDRWYDPATGSWTSEDRLRGEDSNPYRYVGNGPTNQTDPSGRFLVVAEQDYNYYRKFLSSKKLHANAVLLSNNRRGFVVPRSDYARLKELRAAESSWRIRAVYDALMIHGNKDYDTLAEAGFKLYDVDIDVVDANKMTARASFLNERSTYVQRSPGYQPQGGFNAFQQGVRAGFIMEANGITFGQVTSFSNAAQALRREYGDTTYWVSTGAGALLTTAFGASVAQAALATPAIAVPMIEYGPVIAAVGTNPYVWAFVAGSIAFAETGDIVSAVFSATGTFVAAGGPRATVWPNRCPNPRPQATPRPAVNPRRPAPQSKPSPLLSGATSGITSNPKPETTLGPKPGPTRLPKQPSMLQNPGNQGPTTPKPRATLAPRRPTWRQSELDVGKQLKGQGYREQVSLKGGKEVQYGTKESVRPEYYKKGSSVEVKNYDVQTSGGRSNLVRNVTGQAKKRAVELPKGTRQEVRIDVRGQNASRQTLNDLRAKIVEKSNGTLKPEDITFIR